MQSQGQKPAPNTTSKKMAQPGHQTALPALIPQQEPDDQQVEKNCMQCDRDALDVARCPLSGLWFCNDECRQKTRETQSKFFEQMIRNNATKQQQSPPSDAPVRKSGRNTPKAIEIDDSPPKVAPMRRQRAPPQAMDVDYQEDEEQQEEEEEEEDGEEEEDEEVGRLVVPPPVNRTLPLTKKKKSTASDDNSRKKKKTTTKTKSGATHDNSKKKKRPQDTPAKKGKKKSRKAPVVAEKTKKRDRDQRREERDMEDGEEAPIRLVDTLSARQYRATEDMKRGLRVSRLFWQRHQHESDDATNARRLQKLQTDRDALLEVYEHQIKALSDYMDPQELALEQWTATRLGETRADVIQQWLQDDRERVEKLRDVYDDIADRYSDDKLGAEPRVAAANEQMEGVLEALDVAALPVHNNRNHHLHSAEEELSDNPFHIDDELLRDVPLTQDEPPQPIQRHHHHQTTNNNNAPTATDPLMRFLPVATPLASVPLSPAPQPQQQTLVAPPAKVADPVASPREPEPAEPMQPAVQTMPVFEFGTQTVHVVARHSATPPPTQDRSPVLTQQQQPTEPVPPEMDVDEEQAEEAVAAAGEEGGGEAEEAEEEEEDGEESAYSTESSSSSEEIVVNKGKVRASPAKKRKATPKKAVTPKTTAPPPVRQSPRQTVPQEPARRRSVMLNDILQKMTIGGGTTGQRAGGKRQMKPLAIVQQPSSPVKQKQQLLQPLLSKATTTETARHALVPLTGPLTNRVTPPPQQQQPPQQAEKRQAPYAVQLEAANGQHQIWRDLEPLSDLRLRAAGFKMARLTTDGAIRVYVQQVEPSTSGPQSPWVAVLQQQWNMRVGTRGDILLVRSDGEPVGEDILELARAGTEAANEGVKGHARKRRAIQMQVTPSK